MAEIDYAPWSVVRTIGRGSFGTVYEIKRTEFGETYRAALKVISIPQSEDELRVNRASGMNERSMATYYRSCVEELTHEFAILAKMKGHTNIVGYEDHKVLPHTNGIGWDIYIRMELLTSLTTYLSRRDLSRNQVVKLGIDLCQALSLCERKNIIHRDIKPDNIFISEEGDFKLGDFGIARTASKTLSNMSRKGTPNYMAPEIYKNEPYNHTVDIYSLGIVLYQLMNGKRLPFMPETLTLQDRENALGRRMSGAGMPVPAKCDLPFANVILKACAYKPEDRYQSADDMLDDLRGLLSGQKAESLDMDGFLDESDDKEEDRMEKKASASDSHVFRQPYPDTESTYLGEEPGPKPETENIGEGYRAYSQNRQNQNRAEWKGGSVSYQNGQLYRNRKKTDSHVKRTAVAVAAVAAAVVACVLMITVGGNRGGSGKRVNSISAGISATVSPAKKTSTSSSETKTASAAQSSKEASTAAATSLSDDLTDYTFELKGHLYQLPMAYTDFIKNGFELNSSGVTEDTEVPGRSYDTIPMADGATKINVDIYNPFGNTKTLRECYVGGVQAYGSSGDMTVAKGISLKNTPEEIIAALGTPYSDRTLTGHRDIVYQETDDQISGQTSFTIYDDDSADSSIRVRHIVAIEGTEEDVSAQKPSYLDSYVAPSDMSSDEDSTDITIEGKIYRLPCPVDQFTDDGWEIDSKDGDSVAARTKWSGSMTLVKNNKKIYLGLTNFDSSEQLVENCAVTYLNIINFPGRDSNTSFETGIGMKDSTGKDEAKKLLEGYESNEATNYMSLSKTFESDKKGFVSIHYDYNSGGDDPVWSVYMSANKWPYS